MNVAIIILAAGKSSRMGHPKQLIHYKGKSLIKNTLQTALSTKCNPVVVVTGANKEQVVPELINAPITIVDNSNWEKGMGSTIKIGLAGVYMVDKEVDAVIIMTVDMPLVNDKLLNMLIDEAADDSVDIVASKYGNSAGVPALFKRSVFMDILDMTDEDGAKKLILKNRAKTVFVDFPDGVVDLDTPEDVERFLTQN